MPPQEAWNRVQVTRRNAYEHARPEFGSKYNAYRDVNNPGAEIRVNAEAAWRVYPDGREEVLSPQDRVTWFRRLRSDSRRAARNRRKGEVALTAFTEPQKNVLELIGRGHAQCLRPELDDALEDLIVAGLVTFRSPLTPSLTDFGWSAFDRLGKEFGI